MKIGNGMLTGTLVAAALVVVGAGCASLERHRQLEMDHRTLQAEKKQLERDLYDCRNVEDNLQTRITSLENELETQDRLADNYQQENDRLARKCDELTKIVDKIAGGKSMQTPLIIERALPPALDTALKELAVQYPNMVTYDSKRGTVKWASDPLFALASVVVRETAKESLKKFAAIINSPAAAGFEVLIAGHTDHIPIKRSETMKMHPTNWHLSVHRAIAVSDVLQKYGLEPTRIGIMGFGEYRPVSGKYRPVEQGIESEAERAKNRRVEVFIVRKEDVLAGANGFEWGLDGMMASATTGE